MKIALALLIGLGAAAAHAAQYCTATMDGQMECTSETPAMPPLISTGSTNESRGGQLTAGQYCTSSMNGVVECSSGGPSVTEKMPASGAVTALPLSGNYVTDVRPAPPQPSLPQVQTGYASGWHSGRTGQLDKVSSRRPASVRRIRRASRGAQ